MTMTNASVKVMRSFDYCHFEIALSTDSAATPADVNELRKQAARLADEAVRQYQVAKQNAERTTNNASELAALRYRHRYILQKLDGERTLEEKAIVKTIEDMAFRSRPRYDYEDDWQEPNFDDHDN